MNYKNINKIGWILFGCLITFSTALFYFGFYKYFLAGDSTSFAVEHTRYILENYRDATVVVLGDSTASQDFRANYYNRNAAGEKAVNAGVPGTGLFSYDKMARFEKKQAPKINKVIVIMGPDIFCDKDENRILSDIEYNKTSLTVRDIPLIWKYTNSVKGFAEGGVSLIFRPFLFGKDLHNLLLNPLTRLRKIKGTYSWLNRPISVTDPLGEDDRGFNVCGIGDLDNLQDTLSSYIKEKNVEEVNKIRWMEKAYQPRKSKKELNPLFVCQLVTFLTELSIRYEKIYIVNAPIYSGFEKVYSKAHLQKIQAITMGVAGAIPNVKFILPNNAFNDECRNFMDVVHLNKYGAERFTDYLLKEINKQEKKPLILIKYGPEEIKAGEDFNKQANGNSAIWTETENGTQATVLVLNGVELSSVVSSDGRAVTAYVPRKLYKKSGLYPLYLMNKQSQEKSNVIAFTVK